MLRVIGQIAREALWAPVLVIVAHWLAGGWFGHEPVVDPVMHFSGGIAAAFFFWHSAVRGRDYVGRLTLLGLALLAFGLTSAAAAGWELGEFILDALQGSNLQRGLANTMRDITLGMSGACVFVALQASWAVWRAAGTREGSADPHLVPGRGCEPRQAEIDPPGSRFSLKSRRAFGFGQTCCLGFGWTHAPVSPDDS